MFTEGIEVGTGSDGSTGGGGAGGGLAGAVGGAETDEGLDTYLTAGNYEQVCSVCVLVFVLVWVFISVCACYGGLHRRFDGAVSGAETDEGLDT